MLFVVEIILSSSYVAQNSWLSGYTINNYTSIKKVNFFIRAIRVIRG
jgi:hypothetical protein